ncbi:aminotransferase class I/II-fold pyridoxal phosphate-dependent enzyme [Belliella sp. DSM 107340]|uniref:Aminotransferase n=1 Tax=Belliella calami TaxID=2923436 RepID=A0ABS9ULE9_9BACT|nr:aminotransferase class I/II-fold pyridoxal phosphate-dependent enzyme [Belliella calami]MCH7397260.1 aminotransferase class I/II-fold pyridoxal phosphate-dependent enzyme [Belliella calami]
MKGFSKRLNEVQEYYFSQKLKEVNSLKSSGKPILNMGIGSPDLPPHPKVVKAICQAAINPTGHGYQGYQGIPQLREAFSDFYKEHYSVQLDPDGEILPLLGSKEGIMHVSMAFLDAGDQVLIPNPGYPTYSSVCKLLHVEPVYFDLLESQNWEPDFESLSKTDLSKVKLMWVNYPNMPTGAKASKVLFEKLIAFGREHEIVIVHDNPYSFILENNPLSILKINGAMEVALELNSLSKTANMAGWRVGMIGGKKEWIQAITKVKSNMDSGMFLGIQEGAIAALRLEKDWYSKLNFEYRKRRELVWQLAEKLGLSYDSDAVGMFVWAKLPESMNDLELVDKLLYEKSIFITPGRIFGSRGKGFVRFSLCVSTEIIQEAIDRIK